MSSAFGVLEQVSEPAAECAGPSIHRTLADVVRREPVLEQEDVLVRERDVHGTHPPACWRLPRNCRTGAQPGHEIPMLSTSPCVA